MTAAQRVTVWARNVPSWLVYLIGALIPVYYFYLGVTGGLGAEPIRELEEALGLIGLQALIVVLLITPLRKWTGVNLVMHRRALGNLAFYFILCHFLVWAILDVQDPSQVAADIVKRPYIVVGMFGLAAMIPLAMTSNDWAVRKLGPVRWRRLHKLTYLACAAGGIHYLMQAKTWIQPQPWAYLLLVLALLATRLPIFSARKTKKATA